MDQDTLNLAEMAASLLRLPQHLSDLNDEAMCANAAAVIVAKGSTS